MNRVAKSSITLCLAAGMAMACALSRAKDLPQQDCIEGFADRLNLQLGHPFETMTDLPVLMACKVSATNPVEAMFAMASPRKEDALDDIGSYDLHVLLVEHRPGNDVDQRPPKILARITQTAAFAVGSVHLSRLSIDTTNWKLGPGVQAFGIRATMNVRSTTRLYSEDSIRLFRRDGALLRPVLDPMVTHRTSGFWDTHCTGEVSQLQRSLAIGPSATAGYADMIVTEALTDTSTSTDGSVCELSETTRSTARHRLSFTAGEGYIFPSSWNEHCGLVQDTSKRCLLLQQSDHLTLPLVDRVVELGADLVLLLGRTADRPSGPRPNPGGAMHGGAVVGLTHVCRLAVQVYADVALGEEHHRRTPAAGSARRPDRAAAPAQRGPWRRASRNPRSG